MHHPQGLVNRIYAELQITQKIKNNPVQKLTKALTRHIIKEGIKMANLYRRNINPIGLARLCLTAPGDGVMRVMWTCGTTGESLNQLSRRGKHVWNQHVNIWRSGSPKTRHFHFQVSF